MCMCVKLIGTLCAVQWVGMCISVCVCGFDIRLIKVRTLEKTIYIIEPSAVEVCTKQL